jgi:hypothetical protein
MRRPGVQRAEPDDHTIEPLLKLAQIENQNRLTRV